MSRVECFIHHTKENKKNIDVSSLFLSCNHAAQMLMCLFLSVPGESWFFFFLMGSR